MKIVFHPFLRLFKTPTNLVPISFWGYQPSSNLLQYVYVYNIIIIHVCTQLITDVQVQYKWHIMPERKNRNIHKWSYPSQSKNSHAHAHPVVLPNSGRQDIHLKPNSGDDLREPTNKHPESISSLPLNILPLYEQTNHLLLNCGAPT